MKVKDLLDIDRETALISLSYLTDKNRNFYILNPNLELDYSLYKKIISIMDKVKDGYPLQYAIGKWNFFGFDFKVDKRALIPRPETEILVETILSIDSNKKKILDIGTGSGAIAISLSKFLKDSKIIGVDISKDAIDLSNENKELLKSYNVEFIQSDLFQNVYDTFDIIVSNPPYISKNDYEKLDSKLYYEPQNALLAEDNGLFFYKEIISKAMSYLNESGIIIFEIGYNQKQAVINLLKEYRYKDIHSIKDYNGFDRIIYARK